MTDFELYIMSLDRFKNRKPVFVFQLDGSENYDNRDVYELHHAWQASASREGYVIVNKQKLAKVLNCVTDDWLIDTNAMDEFNEIESMVNDEVKATIGVVE